MMEDVANDNEAYDINVRKSSTIKSRIYSLYRGGIKSDFIQYASYLIGRTSFKNASHN